MKTGGPTSGLPRGNARAAGPLRGGPGRRSLPAPSQVTAGRQQPGPGAAHCRIRPATHATLSARFARPSAHSSLAHAAARTAATRTIQAADETVKPVRGRMPPVLGPESYGTWIDRGKEDVAGLLRAFPAGRTEASPVAGLIVVVGVRGGDGRPATGGRERLGHRVYMRRPVGLG